jgi:hypothetical protein
MAEPWPTNYFSELHASPQAALGATPPRWQFRETLPQWERR